MRIRFDFSKTTSLIGRSGSKEKFFSLKLGKIVFEKSKIMLELSLKNERIIEGFSKSHIQREKQNSAFRVFLAKDLLKPEAIPIDHKNKMDL